MLNLFVLPSFNGFHVNERFIISPPGAYPRKLRHLAIHPPPANDNRPEQPGPVASHHHHHPRTRGNQRFLHQIGMPPGKNMSSSPYISYVDIVPLPGDKSNATTTTPDYRLIYFLHIHKSGGSCLCQAARHNHMRTNAHNCNVQIDQRCCGGNDSLEAQQDFARQNALHYSFVANEGDMYRAMDPVSYRYVVMLRDSQSRYKSHWQHVYRNNPSATKTFSSWHRLQPDNWNTRKICGTDCQNIPKYGISRQIFEQTVDRLQRFDHVLFLEDFNRSYTAFARHVHWSHMPVFTKPVRNITYPVEETLWDPFMSVLDDALYEIAKQRFQGQDNPRLPPKLEQGLDEYFQKGPMHSCQNPCCGPVCSQY